MWPINRVGGLAMVHGIAMNVIDVLCKINLIPDLMFPIPPLPDASLTLGLAADSNVLAFYPSPREPGFDERPV
jgi:hypothetical protein